LTLYNNVYRNKKNIKYLALRRRERVQWLNANIRLPLRHRDVNFKHLTPSPEIGSTVKKRSVLRFNHNIMIMIGTVRGFCATDRLQRRWCCWRTPDAAPEKGKAFAVYSAARLRSFSDALKYVCPPRFETHVNVRRYTFPYNNRDVRAV